MSIHDEPTDPHGSPPPSDPQASFSGLVQNLFGEITKKQDATTAAVRDLANLVTRDHVSTSRRLAVLEATRLAPAFAAIVLSLAAFGLAALASSRPAQAGPHCPPNTEAAP